MIPATLVAFGAAIVVAMLFSLAVARSDGKGRPFSVPAFVIAAIVVYLFLAPVAQKLEAERQLARDPIYRQLAKGDPATYEKIRGVVVEGVQNHRSAAETTREVGTILAQAFPERVSHASDDAALSYASVMVQLLEETSRIGPDACFFLLHPQTGETAPVANDPGVEKAQMRLFAALAGILESATDHPQLAPDPEQSQKLLQRVFISLRHKYGNDIVSLNGSAQTSVERKKECELSAEVFREILAMPKESASMAIRYMVSNAVARRTHP